MSEIRSDPDSSEAYPQSLPQTLRLWAERTGDAVAILAPGRMPLTFRRLFEQIEKVVASLNRMGIGRNSPVALVVPDGPEMAVAFLGVASGATVITLDTLLQKNEFDSAFAELDIRALIVRGDLESPAREAARARSIPVIELIPSWEWEAGIFSLVGRTGFQAACPGLAEPEDTYILSRTSGTTSGSKVAASTHRRLCVRAHFWQMALQLNATDRILNVMPLIYGNGSSNGLFSTLFSGGSVVCTPGFLEYSFLEWLDQFHPTYFTGTPTMHRAILDQIAARRDFTAPGSLRFIGATSAGLPRDLLEQLETALKAPVIQMYSSTECGPLAVSPFPPAIRKPGSVGVLAGTEVAIMDEAGNFLPAGETGEIVARGSTLFRGYENNPEANQNSFINGWFRMGDLGYLDDDGYLFLTGRAKEIINRGGQKISPYEVNNALRNHPAVEEAESFAIAHSRLGEEVAAAVVLHKGAAATEQELQIFLRKQLAKSKVPRRILIVDEIPKGPTGKVQRSQLSEKFGKALELPVKGAAKYAPPQTPIEEQLVHIWEEVLGIGRVGIHDEFLSLGGDSIQATLVISRACEAFRIELPLRKFFEATTVAQMAEVVSDAKSSGAAEVSFVRIRGGGSGPPLFWLHGVQGVIFWYQNLADYIDPDHAIYGIVPLKLHTASRHRLRIEDMAAQYVSEIRALQPEGPYFLAGPSAGGIWAFEVARQLDAQRQKVGLVALLDTPCPIRLKDGLLSLSKRVLGYICKAALLGPKRGSKYFLGKAKGSRLGRMFNGFQAAAEELKLIAGFGEEVSRDREFRPLHGPQPAQKEIAAACQWALAHYTPRTYPGRLVLFWAEQPESSVPRFSEFDRRTGWRDIAPGRLEIHRISCIHRNLLAEPHIRVVARRLNEYLEKASPTAPTELRKNSKLGTKSARQTQKRESASSDSSRLLDMGDCKSPDWVRINKDFRKEEYRLQPLWFRFLFRLDFVRKRLGYDRESRLWEYPWAIRSADLERGMRVLDLGSGGSAFPMLLSRYGCQVHASDPSLNYGRGLRPLRWENQVARRLGIPGLWGLPPARMGSRSAVDYAADPIQKLRYRNGYFDRIFCISVMEHIPVRDWASCMAEMSRVLIDGGRLVMTVSMMMPQANERWFEKLLVEPSLELVGSIDYQTPISLEEAQRRHPGQAYETLGLLWEKAQTISPKQTE